VRSRASIQQTHRGNLPQAVDQLDVIPLLQVCAESVRAKKDDAGTLRFEMPYERAACRRHVMPCFAASSRRVVMALPTCAAISRAFPQSHGKKVIPGDGALESSGIPGQPPFLSTSTMRRAGRFSRFIQDGARPCILVSRSSQPSHMVMSV
jgi:hypothetical protein